MVIPPEIRAELAEHARAEAPNEACGLIVLRDGRAERYVRGRNTLASPYRFQLEVDPDTWFLEDEGFELAVFHSHPETAPRPSRTDIENVGLWAGKPYVIYSLARDELAGWRILETHVRSARARVAAPGSNGRVPSPGLRPCPDEAPVPREEPHGQRVCPASGTCPESWTRDMSVRAALALRRDLLRRRRHERHREPLDARALDVVDAEVEAVEVHLVARLGAAAE